MASNSSLNIVRCTNCNNTCDSVHKFPCSHEFCFNCTEKMSNKTEAICATCNKRCPIESLSIFSFSEKEQQIIFSEYSHLKHWFEDLEKEKLLICEIHKQEISICCRICNVIICHTCCIMKHLNHPKPKKILCEMCGPDYNTMHDNIYCIECDQYMCLRCSRAHVRSKQSTGHQIVDKNDENKHINKLSEQFCKEHQEKFTLFCKICEVFICCTCWEKHSVHAKPEDIVDDLGKVFADIEKKMSTITKILKYKINLRQKFEELKTNGPPYNYNKVKNVIQIIGNEIKRQIDVITNNCVSQIISIENQSQHLIANFLNEINDSIGSLTSWQNYYTDLISDENDYNNLNSKPEFYKTHWNEEKSKKELKLNEVTFEITSLTEIILRELWKLFKIEEAEASIDSQVGDVWCQNCKQKFDAEVNIFPCDHQLCKNCATTKKKNGDILCAICGKRCNQKFIKKHIIEPLASYNHLINIVPCSRCGIKYDKVHTLPCLHQFCQKCTKNMENCSICYKSFFKEKVQINISQPSNKSNVKSQAKTAEDLNLTGCYFDVYLKMTDIQKQPVLLKLKQPHNENRDVFNLKQETEIKIPLQNFKIDNRNKIKNINIYNNNEPMNNNTYDETGNMLRNMNIYNRKDTVNINIQDSYKAVKMNSHDSNKDINNNIYKAINEAIPLIDTKTVQCQESEEFVGSHKQPLSL